jgi:hypothetical protein
MSKLDHRAEIDNKGHHAMQWVIGGGIVLLFQFYTQIYEKNPLLAHFIVITAALSVWCLIRSLFLHKKRRDVSLKYQSDAPDKEEASRATWTYWMNTIKILACAYGLLIFGMGISLHQKDFVNFCNYLTHEKTSDKNS